MRRVVTGHTKEGKSVFVRDEPCPTGHAVEGVPNFRIDLVWGTDGVPTIPIDGKTDPTAKPRPFFPAPGGTSCVVVTFPPTSEIEKAAANPAALEAAQKKFYANFPGLGDTMDPAEPGMHASKTVDYGIIVKGTLELTLDDGKKVTLKPGDVVVQNGTRHAWHNPSATETTVAVYVVVGANQA